MHHRGLLPTTKRLHGVGVLRLVLLALVCQIPLTGCVQLPTTEFDSYVRAFDEIADTSETLYLSTRRAADRFAVLPNNGMMTVQERLLWLDKQHGALDARLAALRTIRAYNDALAALAAGTDPAQIEGSLKEMSAGLSALIPKAASIVTNVAPFAGAISQAIAVIDDAIKAERFREGLLAGSEIIVKILDVLRADATAMHKAQAGELIRNADPADARIASLVRQFSLLANKQTIMPKITNGFARLNAIVATRVSLDGTSLPTVSYSADPTTNTPTDAVLAQLDLLNTNIEEAVNDYNEASKTIAALNNLISTYQQSIDAVKVELANVVRAVKGQMSNPLDIARSALAAAVRLRSAYDAFQEAR